MNYLTFISEYDGCTSSRDASDLIISWILLNCCWSNDGWSEGNLGRPRWGNVRDLQFFIRADIFTFPDLFVRYIYICAYYCFQWNKIPWWASPQHHHCLSLTSSTSSFQETRQVESSSAYSACDSDQVFDVDDQLVTIVEIIVIEMVTVLIKARTLVWWFFLLGICMIILV